MRSEADVLAMVATMFSSFRVIYLVLIKMESRASVPHREIGASLGGNTKSDPKPGVLPPIKRCDG